MKRGATMIEHERLKRLAWVLCVTPTTKLRLEQSRIVGGPWYLVGCVEGDVALPRTRGCHTARDALDAVEAWLAPELERNGRAK